jgi:hypothetical protein
MADMLKAQVNVEMTNEHASCQCTKDEKTTVAIVAVFRVTVGVLMVVSAVVRKYDSSYYRESKFL